MPQAQNALSRVTSLTVHAQPAPTSYGHSHGLFRPHLATLAAPELALLGRTFPALQSLALPREWTKQSEPCVRSVLKPPAFSNVTRLELPLWTQFDRWGDDVAAQAAAPLSRLPHLASLTLLGGRLSDRRVWALQHCLPGSLTELRAQCLEADMDMEGFVEGPVLAQLQASGPGLHGLRRL